MDLACFYVVVFLPTVISLLCPILKLKWHQKFAHTVGRAPEECCILYSHQRLKILLDRLWVWDLPATWRCIYLSRSQFYFYIMFPRSTIYPTLKKRKENFPHIIGNSGESGAKSYMTNDLLIQYMVKIFVPFLIYDFAPDPYIWGQFFLSVHRTIQQGLHSLEECHLYGWLLLFFIPPSTHPVR